MRIESPAFAPDAMIPRKHTREGQDISPPLRWSEVPASAKELALVCDDPDAPRDEPFVHWVLYKIPPTRESLSEGATAGAAEGRNDFGDLGWGGPMPPPGHGTHHYRFRLYALDRPVDLGPGARKQELLDRIEDHILAKAEVVGTYERRKS